MWPFDYFKKKTPAPAVLSNPAEPTEATKKMWAQVDARMAELKKLRDENPVGRELDLRIAQEVTKLPGAGYWRRSSWTTTNWEPCKKGDRSPGDAPSGPMSSAADVYYFAGEGFGPRAIPYYTTDANEMMRLIAFLSETRHAHLSLTIFDATDKDWGEVSIYAGDTNCPHRKEYDPNDGHGWTCIDDVTGDTPMHAVALAALEFVKSVKPKSKAVDKNATRV